MAARELLRRLMRSSCITGLTRNALSRTQSKPKLLSLGSTPLQDDFAGLAGKHDIKPFLEFGIMESVSDHRVDIKSALQHDSHFVPGLVHLTAVNAFDGEHRENNRIPIYRHLFFGDPKHRDFGPMAHVRQHITKGGGVAGHFETDIEP